MAEGGLGRGERGGGSNGASGARWRAGGALGDGLIFWVAVTP